MAKQNLAKTEIQTEESLQKITEVLDQPGLQVQILEQTAQVQEQTPNPSEGNPEVEQEKTPEFKEEETAKDEEFEKMQSLKEKAIARNEKRSSEIARLISEQLTEKAVAKNEERN